MLSVFDHRELQAAVLALKKADRELRGDINRATRETMNPVWKSMVTAHLGGTSIMTGRVLGSGVRIAAGNPPVAKAAGSTRGVGDGRRVVPADDYGVWEFGVPNPNKYVTYERKNRRRGGYHVVRRRALRGLPRTAQKGRVVYPAFAEIAPRMVSLWVQLIVKKYSDALEERH